MSSKKVEVGEKYYLPNTPISVKKIINVITQELGKLKAEVDKKKVLQLKHNFSLENQPKIDYDKYGPTFDFQYFLTNYWKYYAYLGIVKSQIFSNNIKIADLGCGAGTFSLAYLSWLNSILTEKLNVDLILIDRSKKQLNYARRFYSLVKPYLNKINLKINYNHKNLQDYKFSKNTIDIFLLGHLFTTDQKIIPTTIKNILDSCKPLSELHTVERIDDIVVWRKVDEEVNNLCLPTNKGSHQKTLKIPFRFGYRCVKIQDSKIGIFLLQYYFDAWRNRSVNKLTKIFEESAIYYEKPFQKPINGLKEISTYWRLHVLKQKNIEIKVIKSIYSENLALSEWTSEFDFEKKHYKLCGILYLTINPDTNLASSLVEYFRTSKIALVK